jgi:adenylate cyclase
MNLSPGSILGLKEKANATSTEHRPSIAILPFVNMGGDKGQTDYDERMLIPLRYRLNKIPRLEVANRIVSHYWYKKGFKSIEIGKKLGVENILEGSLQWAGNHLSVTARLIKVSDGSLLWSKSYDRDAGKWSAFEDEILKAIANKLQLRLPKK